MALLQAFRDVEQLIDAGDSLLSFILILILATVAIGTTVETLIKDSVLELLGEDACHRSTCMCDGLELAVLG